MKKTQYLIHHTHLYRSPVSMNSDIEDDELFRNPINSDHKDKDFSKKNREFLQRRRNRLFNEKKKKHIDYEMEYIQ